MDARIAFGQPHRETPVMRIRAYRDKTRSAHLELIVGRNPWTIDLVAVTAAAILLIGFAAALGQQLLG